MSKELPILDLVQINNPCPMDWDSMTGDDKARHCEHCEKSVYHLSNMTAAEAASVVTRNKGDLCVRGHFRRSDGKLITRPTNRRRLFRFLRRTLVTTTLLPIVAILAGCGEQKLSGKIGEWVKPEVPQPSDPSIGDVAVMGGVGAPPVLPPAPANTNGLPATNP